MQQCGIYEQLITQLLASRLDRSHFYIGERQLESAEASVWLSRFPTRVLEYAVGSVTGDDPLQRQIELANQLLLLAKRSHTRPRLYWREPYRQSGKILTALYQLDNPISANLKQYVDDISPLTGLTQSELFCGSNAGLSMESEIKREILSADSICWLVSFIKWAGIRIFRHELEEFTRSGRQLKVITTSYMGRPTPRQLNF